MSLILKNRVQVTSTSTGTGTFILGSASAGYQSFNAISSTSNAWNISKSEYSNISFSVANQETLSRGLFFKPDGTKMYLIGSTGDDVNEYDLSSPWVISSATYLQNFSVAARDTTPTDVFFKPDGLKMYVLGNANDAVYEYNLSSAWNISTATFLQSFSVTSQETAPNGIFFKPDGAKMYIIGSTGDDVNEYNLSSAWDVSTASYLQNFSVSAQDLVPESVFFKPDGLKMYVVGSNSDGVYEYNLSSAWNVSTASYLQTFSISPQEFASSGLFFNAEGTQFWVVGITNNTIYSYYIGANDTYYAISGGANWEVGIGTVLSGSELVRSRVLGSSNSGALVNWSSGSKTVRCVYPSVATAGGVPYGDDSSVGTDLSGWQAFSTALNNGVVGGQTFGNNSTNGVVSTFSLVNTAAGQSYRGGVLSATGEIHFAPENAVRGQKINTLTGVVSTYSLVYTNSGAWWGGVLASNGDIHFVPYSTDRGQKISASGVVSTYTLIDVGSAKYAGGVLAPNGDIHFIPAFSNVGQKVSAAGVVSTYSLIATGTNFYRGGVLAPNGDIHFVPYNAPVGQKVSAAGVVSTYSLVYTAAQAYTGGVLDPNGNIHFVNWFADRGQKVSLTGVVSTYSLLSTSVSGSYSGGVLAPNGDIHFVQYSAGQGQKISAAGVVSTYSYIAPAGAAYVGGVLAPNGDIYFVKNGVTVGQKISTNPGAPFAPGICLSPFLNKF